MPVQFFFVKLPFFCYPSQIGFDVNQLHLSISDQETDEGNGRTDEVEIPSDTLEEKEGTDDHDGADNEPDVSDHEYLPVVDGLDHNLYNKETEEMVTQSLKQEGENGNEVDKTPGEGKSISVLLLQ